MTRPTAGPAALVTGASGGIGAAIAHELAARGYRVAALARTDDRYPGSIAATVETIRAAGGSALEVECDLSVPDDRAGVVARVEDALGPIDVLVNNAAVSMMVPVAEFPMKRLRLMFEVQVAAPFDLCQQVMPGMTKRGRGFIVNVGSKGALHQPPTDAEHYRSGRGTVYGMCKAALERFSTGLAAELEPHGVLVWALSPTDLVVTPGASAFGFDDPDAEKTEPATDMARAVSSLLGPLGRELNGRVLYSQDVLARS